MVLRPLGLSINTQVPQAHSQPVKEDDRNRNPRAENSKQSQTPHPWAPDSSHPQTPVAPPCPALPCPTFSGGPFSLSLALPPPTSHGPLPTPLVLTSHQPKVQRVKARLCEHNMRGRHEGNPLRGRGRPAGAARPAQEDQAFDQGWPLCQLLGRLQAWGCVCCDRLVN